MINRLINFFNTNLYMPFTITYLYLLNAKNYLLWLFSSPKILQNKPLSSENSVVFALFQKGSLRDDIRVTVKLLKKKGFNIIGVNTQKITGDDIELFDYYVERVNYGQDFGSYKLAFTTLFISLFSFIIK